jgi:hypothetical protein
MARLYLLRGGPAAAGWRRLEREAKDQKIDLVSYDRDRWALLNAEEPPEGYAEMEVADPADGRYLDNHGRPTYVVGNEEVRDARAVVAVLGDEAQELLGKLKDPDVVLERLGRSY